MSHGGSFVRVRAYFEDLWESLPEQLHPPDVALRRSFLAASVRPGDTTLDLGCGTGEFTAALVDSGAEAIGVEVAQAAIDRARAAHPDLDFRLVSVDGPLPFDDGSFDVVWASEVFEHIADTGRWLSELRRVLR